MGHYTIQVNKTDQTHLGITTPWQIYAHAVLLQGIKIAVDFYQREMVKFNSVLDHVKIFFDDTAMLVRDAFDEHVDEIDEVLTRMETTGLKLNIQKSKLVVTQAKHLGCIVSTDGFSPDPAKIQGLVAIK